MRRKIHRRDLLKSAALTALILPVARATMVRAQNPALKRFVVLWHPNGVNFPDAGPSGTETDWVFGDYYDAMARHQTDTIALTELHIGGVPYGQVTEYGHKSGGIGSLTCTPDENTGYATGPSIDQFIAQKLSDQGHAPVRRAPVFGVGNRDDGGFAPVFHESAGKSIVAENNPRVAYEALFGDIIDGMGQDANQIIARKLSILDTAMEDCKSYVPALPTTGRELLEYHCTRIRELETNLQAGLNTCMPPTAAYEAAADLEAGNPNDYPQLTDVFFQIMEVAFLCDLTRVQSFTFGDDACRLNMPWLNPPLIASVDTGEKNVKDHHSHSHAGTRESVGLFMKWYTQKFAELLDRFKTVTPDGTRLFDSTLLFWTTEYGDYAHDNARLQNFVFGNAGGLFATGRHLRFDNDAKHSHALMVSLIQAMGIEGVNQFGHPGGGSGPLDSLYA